MRKKILFLSFFLFTFSCEAQIREFNFFIEEKDSNPVLQLTSVETFSCIGYGIKTREFWKIDTLVVDIRGFLPPKPCYTGIDVAQENILLRAVQKKIFYIKFRWKEYEDKWQVIIKGNSYSATSVHNAFTSWLR